MENDSSEDQIKLSLNLFEIIKFSILILISLTIDISKNYNRL